MVSKQQQLETIGHLAVDLGASVPEIERVATEHGIRPALYINGRSHYDGEAREQIIKHLGEQRAQQDNRQSVQ